MLEMLYQYGITFAIIFLTGALIAVFGAVVAGTVYGFVWVHVAAYKWIKKIIMEVKDGIISANA